MDASTHKPDIGHLQCFPYPAWYLPAVFGVVVATHFFPSLNVHLRNAIFGSMMVVLVALDLQFVAGIPGCHRTWASFAIAWLLLNQDHAYLSRLGGAPPRWIGQGTSKTTISSPSETDAMTFWQRLGWAINLYMNPRGIGWNWQVKGVPPHPDASLPRWKYIVKQVLRVLFYKAYRDASYLLLGFCRYLLYHPSTLHYIPQQVRLSAYSWGYIMHLSASFQVAHSAAALLAVITGLSSPWEWPPLMDSLSKAWSVRQAWGVVYHQNMRRMVQSPSQCMAKAIGLKKGTLASKYFQLFACFFISGLAHYWLSYAAARKGQGEMPFFMLQAVAITIEDFVIWCHEVVVGKEEAKQPSRVLRWMGYIWVMVWFSWSTTLWAPHLLESRLYPGEPDEERAVTRAYEWAQKIFA